MRARTAIVVITALATIGLTPSVASANGGAYIEFKGTHHLPGEVVTGELYVTIPAKRLDLLDRGPFYAYLLPGNDFIEAGRPLPAGAIRVGTFAVERAATDAELTVSFTVPDVAGDYYNVGLCNDPCTLTGFGESVSGSVSIVATAREAKLLTDNSKLHSQLYDAKRDLRKMEKSGQAASDEFAQGEAVRQALTVQVQTLETDLVAAQAAAEEAAGRPLIDPWAAAAIAVALLAAAWALAWRRRSSGVAEGEPVPEGA
jgi:hypothetical protein